MEYGPEVSSTVWGTKIFWEKPLSADKLKSTIELGKLPANCRFMKTKCCNIKVWVTLEDQIRSQDLSCRKFRN